MPPKTKAEKQRDNALIHARFNKMQKHYLQIPKNFKSLMNGAQFTFAAVKNGLGYTEIFIR